LPSRTKRPPKDARRRDPVGQWTRESVLAELRRRARAEAPLRSHGVGRLRLAAAALFGSWRQALGAAGLDPVATGRPRATTPPRRRTDRLSAAGALPAPHVLHSCQVCGARRADLTHHLLEAHGLTPGRYEPAFGRLPDEHAARLAVLAALRAYVARGGEATPKALRAAAPRLYQAVRDADIFESVEAAFAYVAPAEAS
jgi:hypothetical protein